MNPVTIIILIVVALCFVGAIIKLRKDKKSGKSCSCGCSSCPMKDSCHSNNK